MLETESRLEAREGNELIHRITVKSDAPPVALSLEGAPDGLTLSRDDQDGLLSWTPDFDQAGEYVVTIVATDAQTPPLATSLDITIVVEDVNQAPTEPAVTTDATFPVATGATFTVDASATDPDGDDLEWTWTVSEPSWALEADGASVTVTAPSDRGASAVLTVTVSDGEATASTTLDLSTAPNQPPAEPVLTTEATFPVMRGVEVTFTATSEDADDDALTFAWSVSDESWEVVGDGATATVKALEKDATAVLTVTVSDGEATASATYELTSLPNAPPGAPQISTAATMPLLSGQSAVFTATAIDPDGDDLTWTWTVSNTDEWDLASDGSTATVTPLVRGVSAQLTVTVSDGDLTAAATYELSSLTNRAPSTPHVSTEATLPLASGQSAVFTATAIDPDGDDLTWTWTVSNTDEWDLASDGSTATVTPLVRGVPAQLTVTVSDGDLTASATYDISSRANQAPGAPQVSTEATMPLVSGQSVVFTATAVDPDEDDLTWTWTVSDPDAWELETDDATATVTALVRGVSAQLTVTVSDGELTASATYALSSKENVDPSVSIDSPAEQVVVGGSITLTALGTDVDGDDLTYAWSVEGAGWTHTAQDATVTLTAPAEAGSTATVTVTVSDGWDGTATASRTLTSRAIRLHGTVDFLQSGPLLLEASGGETVEVTTNGSFEFTSTQLLPGDTWEVSFPEQPEDQRCRVAGASSGTAASEDIELAVVCTVIRKSQGPASGTAVHYGSGYQRVSGVDSIPLDLSKPAHVLLTLSVPWTQNYSQYEAVWFAITVDGEPIEEAMLQEPWNAHQLGAPLGIVTTMPLQAGEHVIEAHWKGTAGQTLVLHPVELTAVVIESLPHGRGGARAEANVSAKVTNNTVWAELPVNLTFDASELALTSAHVSRVHTGSHVDFRVTDGSPNPLAMATLRYPDSRRSLSLVALESVIANRTHRLQWSSSGAELSSDRVTLSAARFDSSVPSITLRDGASFNTTSTSWERVGASVSLPTLTEEKSVLLVLEEADMGTNAQFAIAEVALRVNGEVQRLAKVQTEGLGRFSSVAMSTIVRLPAGAHEIDMATRVANVGEPGAGVTTTVFVSGLRNLTAIVLD